MRSLTPDEAPREPSRRLFFALWPDEAMRHALAHATREAVRASGGRPVPAANLHVTLAFLGSVAECRLPELARAAGRGKSEGDTLELTFDRLEYWRAQRLLCALPSEPSARVAALARKLQEALAAGGFAPDPKSSSSAGIDIIGPFRPHVTLARKVHRVPRTIEMRPVTWRFTDFALVDSRTLPAGAVYAALEKFLLEQ